MKVYLLEAVDPKLRADRVARLRKLAVLHHAAAAAFDPDAAKLVPGMFNASVNHQKHLWTVAHYHSMKARQANDASVGFGGGRRRQRSMWRSGLSREARMSLQNAKAGVAAGWHKPPNPFDRPKAKVDPENRALRIDKLRKKAKILRVASGMAHKAGVAGQSKLLFMRSQKAVMATEPRTPNRQKQIASIAKQIRKLRK